MDALESAYGDVVERWRALGIENREQLADALFEFRVRFAFNSGNIENPEITHHDTRDIFEDGRVRGFSGDPRTLFEIQNLRDCHELLLDAFGERRRMDESFLLEAHRTLTQGTYDERRWRKGERPGTYKVADCVVGPADVGAPASEVRDEVRALLAEVAEAVSDDALTIATYFHAVLEHIHPFADGNGRLGRALLNHLLLTHNHPPLIVFESDRMAYYGAMEVWDAEYDLNPLRTFFKAEAIRTWMRA